MLHNATSTFLLIALDQSIIFVLNHTTQSLGHLIGGQFINSICFYKYIII